MKNNKEKKIEELRDLIIEKLLNEIDRLCILIAPVPEESKDAKRIYFRQELQTIIMMSEKLCLIKKIQ